MASVNTNDSRLAGIIDERNQMAKEVQGNYDKASGMTNSAYNELIQAAKDYGQQQADIQQQKTDQTLAEIEQEKQKTERDYTKEQKGAYADYVNQTDAYGVNAEKMAAAGLTGSGYEESSKVRMYNAYQNRVAVARQSLNDAITSYNNQKTQAQIANSEALAQIAYQALQTQLQLTIENMQYQNELLNNLTQQKLSVNTSYNQLWQSMYNTLLGESQFNEQMDFSRQQFDYQKQQDAKKFEYQKQRDAAEDARYAEQFNYQKWRDSVSDQQTAEQLAFQKQQAAAESARQDQQFNYQVQRDAVSDDHWEKEYNLTSTGFPDTSVVQGNDSNVKLLNKNTIAVYTNKTYNSRTGETTETNPYWATFNTNQNTTREQVLDWARKLGVDVSNYVK